VTGNSSNKDNLKDMMKYDTRKNHKTSSFTTFWRNEVRSEFDLPGQVIFGPLAVESVRATITTLVKVQFYRFVDF
jgi:hypothetical protein